MRADRLLAMLLHVRRHGGATAPELARRLEVSVRTIYRDVAALQAAGVPLWTEPGPRGGIRLVEGWRLPVDGLTADEAGALFLTGIPTAAAELGLGAVIATAQTKVLATLPPELRARAARVTERFHLDAPGWFRRPEPPANLEVVAKAVWDGRRLDVRYGRPPRPVRRRVDPLGLVLKAGIWYVVAAHRGQPRSYRVSRILTAERRAEPVTRPTDFDLARWWASASGDFDDAILRLEVRLRLAPRACRLAPDVLVGVPIIEAIAAAIPDQSGWREVRAWMENEDVAAEQLAGLGGGVEVLEPATLRRRMRAVGAAMARQNS